MTLLRVPHASLNKSRPYAGTCEYPRAPSAVTISRCGQSAGKADLARGRTPQRLYADHRWCGEDKVRPSRRREEVTRNRGPPESLVNQVTRSNRSERNTLSLNWRLA